MTRKRPDEPQAASPAHPLAAGMALRLAAHRSVLRRLAEFLPLAAGLANSLVVLSEQARQGSLVSQPASRHSVLDLGQSLASSVRAQESLTLESLVEQLPRAQRVWQSAPEQ